VQHNDELAEAVRSQMIAPRVQELVDRLEREAQRGTIEPLIDPVLTVETIVSPLYFRLLLTGNPVDEATEDALAQIVLRGLGYRGPSSGATSRAAR
jgi:hypothetical protein